MSPPVGVGSVMVKDGYDYTISLRDGIGRRDGFKNHCPKGRQGSNPCLAMNKKYA